MTFPRSLQSPRSPLPLLAAGLIVALLIMLAASSLTRQVTRDPFSATTLSELEALSLVAEKMRSGAASQQVLNQGTATFDNGAWRITVGDAQFHFTLRNRVVVADNPAAQNLEFGG